MGALVLVHGSGHGSWCWRRVAPLLERQGHTVTAVDLPGNGKDATALKDVTLDTYAGYVADILRQQPEPAVLVGHSLGGLTITQAAEECPEQIAALVYLTAVLLPSGHSFFGPTPPDPADPAAVRRTLEGRGSWNVADDLTYVVYKEELAQERFYNDCAPEDVAWAKSLIVPQPVGPLLAPLQTTAERFGRVPRIYIECLKDGALFPERQREMYESLPCREVITLNTGHSPFLNAPDELAAHLHRLAA